MILCLLFLECHKIGKHIILMANSRIYRHIRQHHNYGEIEIISVIILFHYLICYF